MSCQFRDQQGKCSACGEGYTDTKCIHEDDPDEQKKCEHTAEVRLAKERAHQAQRAHLTK